MGYVGNDGRRTQEVDEDGASPVLVLVVAEVDEAMGPRLRTFFRLGNVCLSKIPALVGEWEEYWSMMSILICIDVIYAFNSLEKDW